MAEHLRHTAGKALYGALFVALVPGALVAWARATAPIVTLPAVRSPALGIVLSATGAALMLCGMWALRVLGGGLPMNAFPPPKLVTGGVYALFDNPIYVGFALGCAGVSVASGSASGLYLVTPATVLASAALVVGYEAPDLRARFGDRPRPWLHVASDDRGGTAGPLDRPVLAERLATYVLVLVPWVALYEVIAAMGPAPDARHLGIGFEARLPVIEEAEVLYASTYVGVLAAPLLAPTRGALRAFEVRALLAMALVFPLYLALPVVAPPRSFAPHGPLGWCLSLERRLDTPAEAFPSFHVIWALLAAETCAARSPGWRIAARAWAVLVGASCIATGMHTIADVAGGFAAYVLVIRAGTLWSATRGGAERIANSWHEWRAGSLRIINHGAYAGLGTAVALVIVGALLGPGHGAAVAASALAGLVVSALWAQLIEGSSVLMRPYGFYGGILGIVLASLFAPLLGTDTWMLLGAYCVAGPWVQSAGRLRCLVQGCCHGSPGPPSVGIVYRHPRSRVLRIAKLAGVPLHPTPVYSIGWNVGVALAVTRLWWLGAPTSFVAGVYLLLTGVGRFVEEAYRGEPQTPHLAGLRLYQWIAIGSVLAGAVITAVGRSGAAPPPLLDAQSVLVALVLGVVVACALGVDFPDSQRRFSRLA